jgi:hypothetical protein
MSEQGGSEQWGAGYGGPPGYDAGQVPPYGQGSPQGPGYGQQPGHGAVPPYGPPPGYGYPPGSPYGYAAPLPWPHGPGRPSITTTAAVLGFVTGGLTILASLGFLIALLTEECDPVVGVLVLGLPCAAGMVFGSVQLLARRSPTPLFVSALAAVGVLVLALVVAAATTDGGDDVVGVGFFVLLAGVLPVLTAVFARLPATVGWTGSAPPP